MIKEGKPEITETVNGIGFYKREENDLIWWVDSRITDDHRFSFDQKKTFDVFKDYPKNLAKEQKEIFDKENPFWADYVNGR